MKKFFFAIAVLIFSSFAVVNAAPGDKINQKVISSFEKEFSGATDIKWYVSEELVKVNFVYLNNRTEAYFTTDGELRGSARNILFYQLPIAVAKEIEKRYGQAPVYEVTEYWTGNETIYSMIVDLGKKKLKVKSTVNGSVWVDSRVRK